jgi:hypothetical protein
MRQVWRHEERAAAESVYAHCLLTGISRSRVYSIAFQGSPTYILRHEVESSVLRVEVLYHEFGVLLATIARSFS